MKVQVESVSPVKMKLAISVSEEDFKKELDGAYVRVGKSAQIPGFRPGKAPRTLLEKRFGSAIESEVYENLVRQTMVQALEENDLDAVAVPEISDTKREAGTGFSYVASVEVKPKFEPKDYQGVTIKQKKEKVTEEQIQDVFKKLLDAQSVLKTNDRASKPEKGDFVSLLIQGSDADGNLTAPNEEHKEQVYEIGGEILHAEVEKAVVTLKVNELKVVKIKAAGPKDAEGKETEREFFVKVTLKAIKEKILPALTDEFAKSVGPFENLAALKTQVEKDLQQEIDDKAKAETAQSLLEEILKNNPIDLPGTLVHRELHTMMQGFWQQLERAGIREIPKEYSEETLHEKMEPDAKRRVHEQLVIEAIAKKENLKVDEREVDRSLGEIAKASKVPTAELRSYYEQSGRLDGMRFQMLAHKTLDFLLSTATIK